MEANELTRALNALSRSIGPNAEVSCVVGDGISHTDGCIYVSIRPNGILKEPHIFLYADTFEDAIAKANAAWERHSIAFRAETIKKLALAIIHLTFEHGKCTASALCCAGFSIEEVKAYGTEAERAADEMAGGRPFKIVVETP